MDLVDEKLWLGGVTCALDAELLHRHDIKSIVTIEIRPLPSTPDIRVLFIQASDDPSQDLLTYFDQVHKFIDEGKQIGGVLVHCYHGVSRSATLVISYLQKKYHIPRDEALKRVQNARPSVMPNSGFMNQLWLYQEHLIFGTQNTLVMKWYHLQRVSRTHGQEDLSTFFEDEVSQINLKCKKCRYNLCGRSNILQHKEGQQPDWRDSSWVHSMLGNNLQVGSCNKGYFVIPPAWMKLGSSPQGKILCPKCRGKLGSFSWNQPLQCPCSARFQPAFYFVPSKVD